MAPPERLANTIPPTAKGPIDSFASLTQRSGWTRGNGARRRSRAAKSRLSADADTVHHDPYAVMVAVIVVSARRAPCHAGDAAGRQRPSYDGVRLVCGDGETGSIRRVDRERHCGKRCSNRTGELDFSRNHDHDPSFSRKPEGRTINEHQLFFESAQ